LFIIIEGHYAGCTPEISPSPMGQLEVPAAHGEGEEKGSAPPPRPPRGKFRDEPLSYPHSRMAIMEQDCA